MQFNIDQKIGEVEEYTHIQPLTHCNQDGEVYQRSAAVESQIKSALTLAPNDLIERARSSAHQSPDYLQEECLAYLIREHKRKGRDGIVNDLSEILLHRCAKNVNSQLENLDQDVVDDAFQDVIQELFTQILDLESDRGDFLQVRFWTVLKRLEITSFNRYQKKQEEAKNTILLSSLAGYQHDRDDNNNQTFVLQEKVVDSSLTMEQRLLYRDGLATLKHPYRTAFVLRHYYGWQIEATDTSVQTISRYFNVSSRTIRLWLAKAEETLECWRGENDETAQ